MGVQLLQGAGWGLSSLLVFTTASCLLRQVRSAASRPCSVAVAYGAVGLGSVAESSGIRTPFSDPIRKLALRQKFLGVIHLAADAGKFAAGEEKGHEQQKSDVS